MTRRVTQPPTEHYIVPACQLSGTREEVLAQIDELIVGRTWLRQLVPLRGPKPAEALPRTLRLVDISTLRELARRAVADEVGEKAASFRAREGLEPGLVLERVMVCMSSNALAPRVIRTGARIAGRLGSCWYAVYVETPGERSDRISRRDSEALQQNIKLAASLGATVVRVKARKPADGLIAFVQREDVTHVISSSARTDSMPYSCKPTARASLQAFGAITPSGASAPAGAIDGSFASAVNSLSACSCATPDFVRPSRKRNAFLPVSSGQRLARNTSASGSAPIRTTGLKLKSGGSTPTTVRGRPSDHGPRGLVVGSRIVRVVRPAVRAPARRRTSGRAGRWFI